MFDNLYWVCVTKTLRVYVSIQGVRHLMAKNEQSTHNAPDYDPLIDAYHGRHDRESGEPIGQTVAEMIVNFEGIEIDSGSPLSESVDWDSLQRLFPPQSSTGRPDDHLVFSHQGCTIVVYRDGHVIAKRPKSEDSDRSGFHR